MRTTRRSEEGDRLDRQRMYGCAAKQGYVVHEIALRLRPLQREAVEKARRKINGGPNPLIGAPFWRRCPKSPSKSRNAVGRKTNHLRIRPSFYTVWRVVGPPRVIHGYGALISWR